MTDCPGWCCAAFHVPSDGRALDAPDKWAKVEDGEQIRTMLIPLTSEQANARLKAAGYTSRMPREQRFTCKNWDAGTKLCTIYAERPVMCRDFPYGGRCPFGCGHMTPPPQHLFSRLKRIRSFTAVTLPG